MLILHLVRAAMVRLHLWRMQKGAYFAPSDHHNNQCITYVVIGRMSEPS